MAPLLMAVGLVAFCAERAEACFLGYRPASVVPPAHLAALAAMKKTDAPKAPAGA